MLDKIDIDHLFNDVDLNLVRLILEKYDGSFDNIPEYQELSKKLYFLGEQIDNINIELSKTFDEYLTTSSAIREYDYCLMYYLGFKKGLELKKIE